MCLALSLAACRTPTDNGVPCALVRRNEVGAAVTLTEGEISPALDYVSRGAAECDDFTCVRRAGTPKSGDPAAVAMGRCSTFCTTPGGRCDSAVPDVQMECRALILDEVTVGELCQRRPETCATLGGPGTPYLCVETPE